MEQSEFVARIAQRPASFAWLIGAGASRSSGLPTATDILWDLKRRYFRQRENQDISLADLQQEPIKARIQQYMDSKGFPALWSPQEYTTYFEKIFGDDKERQRAYIKAVLSEKDTSLSVGSRVLGAMLALGHCRVAFTTNFDSVVEKAVADVAGSSLSAFHLEAPHAAVNALNAEEYPIYCKLHGDFRYDSIKNLSNDLAVQNAELSKCFLLSSTRFGLVVAGYSGRDNSLMALVRDALNSVNPFPFGLYWTELKGVRPLPAVAQLIDEARARGVNCAIVEVDTYDAFMLRIWNNIDGKPSEIDAKVRRHAATSVSIPLPKVGRKPPLIRFNALNVTSLPQQCLQVTLAQSALDRGQELREKAEGAGLVFTLTDSTHANCWGVESDLRNVLQADIDYIAPQAVAPTDAQGRISNRAFYERGLARSLARASGFITRTRYEKTCVIVDSKQESQLLDGLKNVLGQLHGAVRGLSYRPTPDFPHELPVRWAECLHLTLDHRNGVTWLLLEPDVWIWPPRERRNATAFLEARRKNRFNPLHGKMLDAWIHAISSGAPRNAVFAVSLLEQEASPANPSFELCSRTAYAMGASP